MILSKIEINGFKSFVKRTELKFDGHVTCVVGPNGCGKTNIVDAIRWGLGEQRPSVLRTDRMENIIFSGSKTVKPVGMAEVSVTFDNSKRILPIDYSEVVVTRRLYRSGESEYLLNKTPVRLKDINDLIMDTGIGADAYSVIELKMVEDILSDKAEDRRKLLEEAAGVTKYKYRLRAAVRKLDATQTDLLRVSDIISEVERSVNSLRRQVQKAKRFQAYQEQTKDLELARSSFLLYKVNAETGPLKERLENLKNQREGSTSEITREEAGLEAIKGELVDKERHLIAAREVLSQIITAIHQREGDIRVGKERVLSLSDRITRYENEVVDLKRRLEDQRSHLDVTTQDREALQVKITSTGRLFNNKRKELEVFQQGLNFKRLELNGKKKEIIDCLEEVNRLSNQETSLRARVDNSQGRMERLDEEDIHYRGSQNHVAGSRKEADNNLNKAQKVKDDLVRNLDKINTQLEGVADTRAAARETFYQDQGELESAQSRLSFLHNVLESREGMSDGGKKLLKEKPQGLMGALGDLVSTDKQYQQAVELGLGEAAKYLVMESSDDSFNALKILKRLGGGGVALVALDRVQNLEAVERPSIPKGVEIVDWADNIIGCDDDLRPIAEHLLGDMVVVPNLEQARKLADAWNQPLARIATLDGELVTRWGVVQGSNNKGDDASMVGRIQRIKDLESRIAALGKSMSVAKDDLDALEREQQRLNKKRDDLRRSQSDVDLALLNAEKHRAQINFEGEKAEEGLQRNVDERNKLLQEIEVGKEALENTRPRMEALIERRERIEGVTTHIQAEVERLEEEEGIMDEEVHRLNLQLVRQKGDAKNLDYDLDRSQLLIKEIGETIAQRTEEVEQAQEDVKTHRDEIESNELAIVKDFEEKETQEKVLGEQEVVYEDLKETLQKREREVRDARRSREATAEQIHTMEMEFAEQQHHSQTLIEKIWESYQEDLRKITPPDEIDLDAAEEEIEELKRKMRALGGVNLEALDEFEEESKRFEFLSQQHEDLTAAEETLKETILKINQTARERFEAIFKDVRIHFQQTFARFFEGGEADLLLPEDEDPLEAQIEIKARPAGKAFRDLSLLSGGERALTAISLLFALYLVKPSPFCILDEIDAPLDDTNVGRFTRVLNEFAERTQFVIVTHNKATMKAARALYGVTQEVEGISKLVSVRFQDDEDKAA
ncbi:chromosome segregation protein SMC [bacterium]|nr:chromosome segregation protein SMC [bacterium]